MLFELRTVQYQVGNVHAVNTRFGDAVRATPDAAHLRGAFISEVGDLNQQVQVWRYRDADERESVLAASDTLRSWRDPEVEAEYEEVTLLSPMTFSHDTPPGSYGSVYEIRTYSYGVDFMDEVDRRWALKVPGRSELSPFIGAWQAETGRRNLLVHIWAYDDAAQRQRIRAEAIASGVWPPNTHVGGKLLHQRNQLVVPLSCSPWC